jgi:hypothetical protein
MFQKNLRYTLFFLIVTWTTAAAEIFETAHFSEILRFVKPNTLVLLDIDDTLLIPTQTLGTDAWFIYRTKQHEKSGLTYQDALEKAIAEWEAIRNITDIQIVEEGTDQIIDTLQKKNIAVMGLTTQGLALATRTIQQLQSLTINLSRTAPSQQDQYFMNENGVLYRHGILFTSGTPKGKAFLKLIDILGCQPQHIVFINDKAKHLSDVEEGVEARGIDFVGLRYSFSDQRVATFNKDIAEIQWRYSTFEHLLSDSEAEEILKKTETIMP